MEGLTDRLNQIFKHYKMSKYSEFAEKTGLSHQVSSNYLKGKQKPDAKKLGMIVQSFDEINAEWLLTGNGEMLKKDVYGLDENEINLMKEINLDFKDVDVENLVRFIIYNQDKLMQNPIFENFIKKIGYESVVNNLTKQ